MQLAESQLKSRQLEKAKGKLTRAQDRLRALRESLLLDALVPDSVLSRELVAALNEPDEVKEILAANVKTPSSDADIDPEDTRPTVAERWRHFIDQEETAMRDLTTIKAVDVLEGDFYRDWADRADQLTDLKYSLRARAVIVDLISEILRRKYAELSENT